MLGTGLDWWLFALFAATAIIGSVWTSKLLRPVPDVGLIIKYNFPKDAGYYQKGERKTTPVSDSDILYHIKVFLPFIQIGMFVFAAALFGTSHQSRDIMRRVGSINFDGGQAELIVVEQGAFGSYADLRIYNNDAEHIESIYIYISERRIPCPLLTASKAEMSMSVIVIFPVEIPSFRMIESC